MSGIERVVGRFWSLLLVAVLLVHISSIEGAKKPTRILVDTDVVADDVFALLYLLKFNRSQLELQAITISANMWTDAGHSVNHVYDLLYMMNRDDIVVGVGGEGGILPNGTILPDVGGYLPIIEQGTSTFGGCRYRQAVPRGRLYTDTNYGIRRSFLPQNVYVVGGHFSYGTKDKGNLFSVPTNKYTEFNMFLDPTAAKTVLASELNITIIPLNVQRQVCSFPETLKRLKLRKITPEAGFIHRLLSRLYRLQRKHHRYQHMDTFLGEILGAVFLAGDQHLNSTCVVKPVKVLATGDLSKDGQIIIDEKHGKPVNIVESVNNQKYYATFANLLGEKMQSAVIGSFDEQKQMWSTPTYQSLISCS